MIRRQLQEAEFDPHDFDRQRQSQHDMALLVKFYYKPWQDPRATKEEGRPIFKERLYVDIRVPGDRESSAVRPASERDIERFRPHYEAFMKRVGDKEPEVGTPLSEWPQVTRAQVEELAFFNCKTVEHLASMSDSNAQKFMGLNTLRTKAKEWLEKAAKVKDRDELLAQLEERDKRLAELEARLNQLEQPSPARTKAKARGRPRKQVAEVGDGSATASDG